MVRKENIGREKQGVKKLLELTNRYIDSNSDQEKVPPIFLNRGQTCLQQTTGGSETWPKIVPIEKSNEGVEGSPKEGMMGEEFGKI